MEDYAVTIGTVADVTIERINDDGPTRSEITSLEVTFDSSVDAVASDFVLVNTTTGQNITGIVVSNSGIGVSTLTFTPGPGVITGDNPGVMPTLADGFYERRYRPDFDENGLPIGGEVLIDEFFRKYGKTDATSTAVGLTDFAAFRGAFGT